MRKFFFQKLVSISEVTDEKTRIRKSIVRIQGSVSGSIPKCHGSGTLLDRYLTRMADDKAENLMISLSSKRRNWLQSSLLHRESEK
jgi:hypothetical protein